MNKLIQQTQSALNELLPAKARLRTDGVWGPKTKQACIDVFGGHRERITGNASIKEQISAARPAGCIMSSEILIRLAKIESNLNPKAVNASSAAGLYQIVDSTARNIRRKLLKGFTLNDRFDVEKSTLAICALWKSNAAYLKNKGLEASVLNLWGMHNLGPSYVYIYKRIPHALAFKYANVNLPNSKRLKLFSHKHFQEVADNYMAHWAAQWENY